MPPIRKLNKKAAHLRIFAFARCAREHLVLVTVLAAEEHLLFGVRFHQSIVAVRAACRHVQVELGSADGRAALLLPAVRNLCLMCVQRCVHRKHSWLQMSMVCMCAVTAWLCDADLGQKFVV